MNKPANPKNTNLEQVLTGTAVPADEKQAKKLIQDSDAKLVRPLLNENDAAKKERRKLQSPTVNNAPGVEPAAKTPTAKK